MPLIRVWEERRDATWRLVGEANDGSWTQSLREQFLLRTDAAPISADRYVSPEVEPEAPGAIEIRLLTLTTIEGDPIAEEVGATPEGWLLLGYDVCDESLLSGLTDCGYSPEELPAGALVELPPENGLGGFRRVRPRRRAGRNAAGRRGRAGALCRGQGQGRSAAVHSLRALLPAPGSLAQAIQVESSVALTFLSKSTTSTAHSAK